MKVCINPAKIPHNRMNSLLVMKICFAVLLSNPKMFIAAAIILDFNTTDKKSLSAPYADLTSVETFLLFITVRSTNIVHWSTAEQPP